ncbi:MAG: 3-hydroxybutyryl-CoA dehydrogenase [Bacteroidetes bacterium]|nr:3-hydroxybutyryl-CoA dehydrogenase [Bacteroidota bacterium]MCB0803504.1 3-hydroxybutyryl-CoA dehydrogenase [Flavobacteriales bacterium]NOG58473.1 3-hydroxybutyryl-CoA dehydrogenase [Bacteroidota bacterium]
MNVGIIGCGTMGSGIAQVAATANCKVVVYDVNEQALEKSKIALQRILARLVEKGRINQDKSESISSLIIYSADLNDFSDAELIIEAIVENPDIKKSVFQNLESIVSSNCIIASNTSSLSITSLAACLKKPERFIGVHFFNPAPLMKLVEIIPAIQTDAAVLKATRDEIDRWGKTTVQVKDTPGFIVNKVARPFYGEALRIYEEGIADCATIDWAMKTLGGFRMGPFELMDFIGNDVNYTVTETVFKAFYYDSRYKPAFAQKRLSEAGYLGRKSGRGYYNYAEGAVNPSANEDEVLARTILNRVLVMLINEAADTLYLNIANAKDIDLAMCYGVNYPKGLLAWADEIGIQSCVEQLDKLYHEYHEERYRCCPLLRKMSKSNSNFF